MIANKPNKTFKITPLPNINASIIKNNKRFIIIYSLVVVIEWMRII